MTRAKSARKYKRVLRLRLEVECDAAHDKKTAKAIERELLSTEMRAGHGVTGKILGVDGEWGQGKEDYTVWFWQGKLLYLLFAVITLVIMAFAIAKFPDVASIVLGAVLFLLSIWLLVRDVWKGWIGVSYLQAAVATVGIAATWDAPLKLYTYLSNM